MWIYSVLLVGITGIFEKHKLLFSFQMTIKLEQSEDRVTQNQLEFFIKGNVSLEKSTRPCPARWISPQVFYYVVFIFLMFCILNIKLVICHFTF